MRPVVVGLLEQYHGFGANRVDNNNLFVLTNENKSGPIQIWEPGLEPILPPQPQQHATHTTPNIQPIDTFISSPILYPHRLPPYNADVGTNMEGPLWECGKETGSRYGMCVPHYTPPSLLSNPSTFAPISSFDAFSSLKEFEVGELVGDVGLAVLAVETNNYNNNNEHSYPFLKMGNKEMREESFPRCVSLPYSSPYSSPFHPLPFHSTAYNPTLLPYANSANNYNDTPFTPIATNNYNNDSHLPFMHNANDYNASPFPPIAANNYNNNPNNYNKFAPNDVTFNSLSSYADFWNPDSPTPDLTFADPYSIHSNIPSLTIETYGSTDTANSSYINGGYQRKRDTDNKVIGNTTNPETNQKNEENKNKKRRENKAPPLRRSYSDWDSPESPYPPLYPPLFSVDSLTHSTLLSKEFVTVDPHGCEHSFWVNPENLGAKSHDLSFASNYSSKYPQTNFDNYSQPLMIDYHSELTSSTAYSSPSFSRNESPIRKYSFGLGEDSSESSYMSAYGFDELISDGIDLSYTNHTRLDVKHRDLQFLKDIGDDPLYWNKKSTEIIEAMVKDIETRESKVKELEALYSKFVKTAKRLAKIIIVDRNLPFEEKTIKPLDGPGIAGGEKYAIGGIFFKFAINNNGIYADDESASKVAKHECLSSSYLFSVAMLYGLHCPLMVLLDWCGYRILCISLLPIDKKTLCYGSMDGGNTVFATNPTCNSILKNVSQVLNLKGHWAGVGFSKCFLYAPCDIEGHLGKDGKLYMVDTARLFPCEDPTPKSSHDCFLTQLLRPEFVCNWLFPLSSDAFSKFGASNSHLHNAEVQQATTELYTGLIPSFAKVLDTNWTNNKFSLHGVDFITRLHENGINVRMLGKVRMHAKSVEVREYLLEEMVARCIKQKLKKKMRSFCHSCATSEFFSKIKLFYLDIFSSMKHLWGKVVKKLCVKFPGALSQPEKTNHKKLYDSLSLLRIFNRVNELAGIEFSEETDNKKDKTHADTKSPSPSTLSVSSLLSDSVSVKCHTRIFSMCVIPRLQADVYAHMAKELSYVNSYDKLLLSLKYYNTADALYKKIVSTSGGMNVEVNYNWGIVKRDKGVLLVKMQEKKKTENVNTQPLDLFTFAASRLEHCLTLTPPNSPFYLSLLILASLAEVKTQICKIRNDYESFEEVKELFSEAWEKYLTFESKNKEENEAGDSKFTEFCYSLLYNWANFYYEYSLWQTDTGLRLQLLHEAVEIYEKCAKYSDESDCDLNANYGCALIQIAKLDAAYPRSFSELCKEGKEKFLKTEKHFPGSGAYNLACVASLCKDEKETELWLNRVSDKTQLKHAPMDPDFNFVKNSPWFVKCTTCA